MCGEDPPGCDDEDEDADHDGVCDDVDGVCNADGEKITCEQAPPNCRVGTVPEGLRGCYSNVCVTWEECDHPPELGDPCEPIDEGELGNCDLPLGWAPDGGGACVEVSGCECGPACEGRVFDSQDVCEAACLDEVQACGGFAGIACPGRDICFDDPRDACEPPRGADCPGVCVGPELQCTRVDPGEFGECREALGWGAANDGCVPVSGCECDVSCAGRVFPTEAACADACDGGEQCPDADDDGRCDAADPVCNVDGEELVCARPAPLCPRGRVPVVRDGCYTEACVTWEDCRNGPDIGPIER